MSWFASGTVEGPAGEDGMWGDGLTWSPSYDTLDEAPKKQADFALKTIGAAFADGVIEGKYSCSISGHDNPEQENDRKSFSMSFSPVA